MPDAIFDHPRLAEVYDALDPDRNDLGACVALVGELGVSRVLDVGCGTGVFALLLAGRGIDVVGVDPAAASLTLPPLQVDLATMTGNVAQAIVERADWQATLDGIHGALRPGGRLVLETRDPARQAWQGWGPTTSRCTADVAGVGAVESWTEVTEVALPLVSFRCTFTFAADGAVLTSDSTLRFRERTEVEEDLVAHGFVVEDVRDAPDRPGLEFVFVARRVD